MEDVHDGHGGRQASDVREHRGVEVWLVEIVGHSAEARLGVFSTLR